MKYTKISKTELNVSVITLGTWVFGGVNWSGAQEEDSIGAVGAAIDCGINCIDTAPIYGDGLSEKIVGKAIKGKRDKVIIATKCGLVKKGGGIEADLSPKSLNREIDDSLRRLGVEYIDLYQCHWPDPGTPIEQTLEALNKLKEKNKIRYIGVSNFDIKLLKKAAECTQITTTQNQYSLLERSIEDDILPYCQEKEIGVIVYGALAGGILTGKYQTPRKFDSGDARNFLYKYYDGVSFEKTKQRIEQLKKLGRPLNQVALNWVCQQKGITSVIVGCRNKKQVQDNVLAATWNLSQDELRNI